MGEMREWEGVPGAKDGLEEEEEGTQHRFFKGGPICLVLDFWKETLRKGP